MRPDVHREGHEAVGTVYILRSAKGKYYVGSTNDWNRRKSEHFRGQTRYTRIAGPFELVFKQDYQTVEEARKIEFRLKKLKSRVIIERVVKEGKIKLGW